MNLIPSNQTKLYGLENELDEFIRLFSNNKLPNKIIFSGQKGIGKTTLCYHLINFILSKDEEYSYDVNNYEISQENKSFKLIQNGSNPNFSLIDIKPDKKFIDIDQIRNLIQNLNKSSFNQKPKFVLIDNIEFLNLSSINALLKSLEEPNINIHFFLINNNKNILDTLRSRCLNYKIFLSNQKTIEVSNKLLKTEINNIINKDLLNYYITPGKIYNLVKFSNEKNIDLIDLSLSDFLTLIIENSYYKKENSIRYMIFDFIEFYLRIKKVKDKDFKFFNYFLKKIENTYKFNLDEESLYLELKTKLLNE